MATAANDVQMVTMAIRDKVDANLVCVQVVMEAECNTLTRAVWIHVPTFRVLSVTAGGATLVHSAIGVPIISLEIRTFPAALVNRVIATTTLTLTFRGAVTLPPASVLNACTTPKAHSAKDAKLVSMETQGDRTAGSASAAFLELIVHPVALVIPSPVSANACHTSLDWIAARASQITGSWPADRVVSLAAVTGLVRLLLSVTSLTANVSVFPGEEDATAPLVRICSGVTRELDATPAVAIHADLPVSSAIVRLEGVNVLQVLPASGAITVPEERLDLCHIVLHAENAMITGTKSSMN